MARNAPKTATLSTTFLALGLAVAAAQGTPSGVNGPGGGATQQSPVPGGTGSPGAAASEPAPGEPGFTTGLLSSSRTNLLGDIYGLRTFLGGYGISLGLNETSEVFGNATGGIRRGAAYSGLTSLSMGIDTQRAFGLEGGTFNVSAFQIHGRNIQSDNLLTLLPPSGIEANRATRLWELWYQQAFFGGRVDVKIGQQSLDQEFFTSQGSGLFINTAAGWPLIPSVDQYSGGPAYPLSSLGVRLRAQPFPNAVVLLGVFDDNPGGGPFFDDGQTRGATQSGTKFSLNTGALIFGELQYSINSPALGELDRGDTAHGLPGTYKIGAWFDTGNFPDQRSDTTGLSLADPNSNGINRLRRHNFEIYAVADQLVWRPDPDEPMALGVFARIGGSPADRNVVDFNLNTGITLKAPLPGRDGDTFGVEYGFGRISKRARQLDQDTQALANGYSPIRGSESFIEVTYQIQVAPWWTVQPNFQYVWTPGGGIANPLQPDKRVSNEAIFGLRTGIVF